MVLEHMRRLCGRRFSLLGRAVLPDFEIGLGLRGYANIRAKKGAKVFGLLYDIDEECLDALDSYEGYPDTFGREMVSVIDEDKKRYKAWVYIESADEFGGVRINEEYFKRVIAAARENHLPEDWIRKLESISLKPAREGQAGV